MNEENAIVNELHRILVKPKHKTEYESITVDYSGDLFNEICESYEEYFMIGWTVCGAQDPAVIYLGEEFIKNHPELEGHWVVRVIDKFLNEWSSATLLEFSSQEMTEQEYEWYDNLMREEENE